MKKLISYTVGFAAMAFVALSADAQDNVIDRVEWVVGDKAILRSDIEQAMEFQIAHGQKFDGDPYCIVGEDLAVQQLFLHQAAIDSIEIPETQLMRQVDAELEDRIQRVGSKEKFEEYMQMSSGKMRERLREMFYNMNMMALVKKNIVGEVKISPALVRRYYESLPADEIPFIPSLFEVQILTLEPSPELEEIERVKSDLREYTERINSGETAFSTMALLYSQDPESARRGGELGFTSRGVFAPEFANVAFALTDPNKVSKIVETEYGFHIIQLIDKRGDRVNVRHILRIPEVSNERIKARLVELDSIAGDIRQGKISFENCAAMLSNDKDTRNNDGIMYNKQTGSPRFRLQDLPVDVARIVEDMNVGEVSEPFIMRSGNGKNVCAIVKLKSRMESHKANLKDDYDTLKEMYVASVSDKKVEEWIAAKQKTTFVRINSDSFGCKFKYPGWVFYEDNK